MGSITFKEGWSFKYDPETGQKYNYSPNGKLVFDFEEQQELFSLR